MNGKLGIVAGGGDLPRRLIEIARESGREVFVVALSGHTDPRSVEDAAHAWFRLGEISRALARLRQEGVRDLVMIGPVSRPSLKEVMTDAPAFKFLSKVALSALGDDGLLRALIRALEDEGFKVHGVDELLSGLLARQDCYGANEPDGQARRDIERGLAIVKGIGALDIGQAAVVQQGMVIGVEAVEGTDRLLERCGPLQRQGPGGVLVKASKPGQERRVDLPTIGPETVEKAASQGLRGIAMEAGGVLVVDEDRVIEAADRLGLFVIGIQDQT